jgi:hypothetical protein
MCIAEAFRDLGPLGPYGLVSEGNDYVRDFGDIVAPGRRGGNVDGCFGGGGGEDVKAREGGGANG